jgi:hypothetical protein
MAKLTGQRSKRFHSHLRCNDSKARDTKQHIPEQTSPISKLNRGVRCVRLVVIMATVYKIHPAIGIARIGNSPDEFFIGPERIGERPDPSGGFKDSQCRVKRQAARFRIFAHHDNNTVEEITSANAQITWTVHLVNQKAAMAGRGNNEPAADITIDPGPRTLNGPNQRKVFDTGTIKFQGTPATTVPLGEIRTDHENHLLVLGGFGKSASPGGIALSSYFWATQGWYDDISDGSVTATIKLQDNSTPTVVGAWVIVAPPKFAPHLDSVITLYDRIFDSMVDGGLIPNPAATSYTQDVYPILQRARDTRWVVNIAAGVMAWPDPVTSDALRTAIFSSLKAPLGGGDDMPLIYDSTPPTLDDRLTKVQYAHMQRWKDNTYTNDWSGPPAPEAQVSPDGMDRAALEAGVGRAFYPGIEAGGLPGTRPIADASLYSEPFRLNPAKVAPGDITKVMACPWQNDFWQCAGGGDGNHWWPVPRPDDVLRNGVTKSWTDDPTGSVASGQDMVDKWSMLGFIVRQGNQYAETARCVTPSITLLTPVLNFQDVPQGPMGMVREIPLAITFEVVSPSTAITLEYTPGAAPNHPQLIASNTSVNAGPTPANSIAYARLWVIYRTSSVGDVLPPQQVTVQQQGTANQWTITIMGNTVARKTAAVALALDRSGSMSEDRGDGQSKHDSLQQAANIFVQVMLEGDGIGLVAFNDTSHILQQVLQLGSGGISDLNRNATTDIINGNGLDPQGSTSIGNSIVDARNILNSAANPYDVKALVVLTDGVENTPKYIADVAPQIAEDTYAIGLGTPQNTSAPALQAISGNHGGFLLVTGAIGTDNRFLLQKYFLQILAGVSSADIVLDPDGQLIPGRVEKIPFQVIEGDAGIDVILLTLYPQVVDFRLQSPSGRIIEPWLASSNPQMRYRTAAGVSYYRVVLPTELQPHRFDHGGTWHALLSIGKPRTEPSRSPEGLVDVSLAADLSILQRINQPVVQPRWPTRSQMAAHTNLLRNTDFLLTSAGVPATAAATTGQRTLPYSLVVHAYSNVSLRASVQQSSFEPGAKIGLYATVALSGLPTTTAATVWAEVTRPDKSTTIVNFHAADDQFSADFITTSAGIYRFRVRARGTTRQGETFLRERTLTAGVWAGGDRDADPNGNGQTLINYLRDRDAKLCELLQCLTRPNGVINSKLEERLQALGLDLAQARKCLSILCTDRRKNPNKDE